MVRVREDREADARIVSGVRQPGDSADTSLRPQALDDFIGQRAVCANLRVFVTAACSRREALDHVLLSGPPGLGKTTLAQIIARELGVNFRTTSGPMIARAGDLAALLTNLERRDVMFIDEIHRLPVQVEEVLYTAMEDFQLDLIIGAGPVARSVRIDLQPFTLVGATTRTGLLTTPLRDRFGIPLRLDYYDSADLERIVQRGAQVIGVEVTDKGAAEIARRSRGTPRVAGRLLRRIRDFAIVAGTWPIDARVVDAALVRLDVDDVGLDALDQRYLRCLAEHYGGGPVGADTLAAVLSEQRDTLEEVVEPFLLQRGLLQRTPRGRLLSEAGFRHLGLSAPARRFEQFSLLQDNNGERNKD